jgi:hypothetical protein
MKAKSIQILGLLALGISLVTSQKAAGQPIAHDILHPAGIGLNVNVSGTIAPQSGLSDFYRITSPSTPRDLVRVSLENRSTNLRAGLRVFDSQKSPIANASQDTAGANVEVWFATEPASVYYVQVEPFNKYDSGAYVLSVTPQYAYDKYEPNDDILHAAPIALGDTIRANCMNGVRRIKDDDYYRFISPAQVQRLKVSLTNQSTTLRPSVHIFDSQKSEITSASQGTFGGDVEVSFVAKPNSVYYVWVEPFNAYDYGNYSLTVREDGKIATRIAPTSR